MFDLKFHHISLTIPIGAEEGGRQFYCNVLGFVEIEKPESLKKNGGFWLQCGNLELHIGVEEQSDRRASKRHAAFETDDLPQLRHHLIKNGYQVKAATEIPGYVRFYTYDPFGNRLEFISHVTRFLEQDFGSFS